MILGNELLIDNLKSLVDARKLAHSYLLFGQQRVGKKLIAEALGQYCERGEFSRGKVLQDTFIIEPDAQGTLGIDAVRAGKALLLQQPSIGPYRIMIVNDAHKMTPEAQNALLKVAEEPPERAVIVLVTHVPEALADTVCSRFQSIFVPSVPAVNIQTWLHGEEGCDTTTAAALAKKANGAPGLAWALLHDESFKSLLASADRFFTLTSAGRKDFLKEVIDDDAFELNEYLDALIINCAWAGSEKHSEMWHRLLKLRTTTALYNVNPRLQLEALAAGLL